jgi:hypothetical protein
MRTITRIRSTITAHRATRRAWSDLYAQLDAAQPSHLDALDRARR